MLYYSSISMYFNSYFNTGSESVFKIKKCAKESTQ
jgi:hypothetical protein